MFLVFMDDAANIVVPKKHVLEAVLDHINIKNFKLVCFDEVIELEEPLDGVLNCINGNIMRDGFVPVNSKRFMKDVLNAESLIINGAAVNSSERFSGYYQHDLMAVLCSEHEVSKIDASNTRVKYNFTKGKFLTTTQDLGVNND